MYVVILINIHVVYHENTVFCFLGRELKKCVSPSQLESYVYIKP